jgi:leucyl/phenylalanyl-tRNA--protein transferase
MIPWLDAGSPFPPIEHALKEPNGLLAVGGDLGPARLLDAYRHGIFPWFSAGDPILWWSPDPRMVLFPAELKLSRSLAKSLRNKTYEVRLDSAFAEVMLGCAAPRAGHPPDRGAGTWITAEMRDAYQRLHELGYAHSAETWIDGKLAGGLYGVAIGRMFFGESMFARRRDASKIALVHLMHQLEELGFGMVDCQMRTDHLASLGAREISRTEFSRRLAELINYPDMPRHWNNWKLENQGNRVAIDVAA